MVAARAAGGVEQPGSPYKPKHTQGCGGQARNGAYDKQGDQIFVKDNDKREQDPCRDALPDQG